MVREEEAVCSSVAHWIHHVGSGNVAAGLQVQAGVKWESLISVPSWRVWWKKRRRLKQNPSIEKLTLMDLPFVSNSGLKLQRRSRGFLVELSTHVTSELRADITLVTQENRDSEEG